MKRIVIVLGTALLLNEINLPTTFLADASFSFRHIIFQTKMRTYGQTEGPESDDYILCLRGALKAQNPKTRKFFVLNNQ